MDRSAQGAREAAPQGRPEVEALQGSDEPEHGEDADQDPLDQGEHATATVAEVARPGRAPAHRPGEEHQGDAGDAGEEDGDIHGGGDAGIEGIGEADVADDVHDDREHAASEEHPGDHLQGVAPAGFPLPQDLAGAQSDPKQCEPHQ